MKLMENFPSLRSFDEFIGNKATFKLPTTENINIRMKKNLLYYQTNYFVIMFCLSVLYLCTHIFETASGLLCLILCVSCYHISMSKMRTTREESQLTRLYDQLSQTIAGDDGQKRNIVNLVAGAVTCLVLFSYGKNMLLSVFIVLLSSLICLIHAACRKIDFTIQFSAMRAQITRSPMYQLISALDSQVESYFASPR